MFRRSAGARQQADAKADAKDDAKAEAVSDGIGSLPPSTRVSTMAQLLADLQASKSRSENDASGGGASGGGSNLSTQSHATEMFGSAHHARIRQFYENSTITASYLIQQRLKAPSAMSESFRFIQSKMQRKSKVSQ